VGELQSMQDVPVEQHSGHIVFFDGVFLHGESAIEIAAQVESLQPRNFCRRSEFCGRDQHHREQRRRR
jgi:hypothetical protein